MRIGDVEVNVTDPENLDFFDDLAKREYQQKELNLEYRKQEENRIDEEIKKKEEQIEQLKKDIFDLEENKNSLEWKTFFDEKKPFEKAEQIELEFLKRKSREMILCSSGPFNLKSQIYEQIKNEADWLDFETTKELFKAKLYKYDDDTGVYEEDTETEKWFDVQDFPKEVTISASLLDRYTDKCTPLRCDTLEDFLKEREESLENRLYFEVHYFYRELVLYLSCKKFIDDLSKEYCMIELELPRMFQEQVRFLEEYNKKKEGK